MVSEEKVAEGHWLIHGYDVKRASDNWWLIYDYKRAIARVETIDAARSWIRERRLKQGHGVVF